MSQEVKETTVATEEAATTVTAVTTESSEPNEREARRGSRDRAPRGERRDREETKSPFTKKYKGGDIVRMPIAHAEGNYFADEKTLKTVEDKGLVAFRYATPQGEVTQDANPNGSLNNIAGIFNQKRTVLGLMPHPERLSDPKLGGNDGRKMFDGLVEALS